MDTFLKKYNHSSITKILGFCVLFSSFSLVSAQSKDTIFVDYERLDAIELSSGIDEERRKQYMILKFFIKNLLNLSVV